MNDFGSFISLGFVFLKALDANPLTFAWPFVIALPLNGSTIPVFGPLVDVLSDFSNAFWENLVFALNEVSGNFKSFILLSLACGCVPWNVRGLR